MSVILNFLKQNTLVLMLILIMTTLGTAINALIPWSWLTNFFIIVRHLMAGFDFILPINTILILIAASYSVELALWTMKGGIWIINWFKHH